MFKRIAECLRQKDWNVVVVYCVDSTFVSDASKFIAGNLTALSAMVQLELPHVNVLTKVDLLPNKDVLERFLSPSGEALAAELSRSTPPRLRRMNIELCRLLDEYDMISFLPLDVSDDDSIASLLAQIDNAIQYGEDLEPKEPRDEGGIDEEDEGEGDDNADNADDS